MKALMGPDAVHIRTIGPLIAAKPAVTAIRTFLLVLSLAKICGLLRVL